MDWDKWKTQNLYFETDESTTKFPDFVDRGGGPTLRPDQNGVIAPKDNLQIIETRIVNLEKGLSVARSEVEKLTSIFNDVIAHIRAGGSIK